MAVLRIPEENRTITGQAAVSEYLTKIGIEYDVWEPSQPLRPDATQEATLQAYFAEIAKQKARGGNVTAAVINVNPQKVHLVAMVVKFTREHWNEAEDVR